MRLTSNEIVFLREALDSDYKISNIRLREGEYQYDLVKTLASFHMELLFPDVKNIIKRLYGEERASDIQFVRKIQTILKKMEKSGIVRILPKDRPWELQRYALSSFRFQDTDRNDVVLATDQQMKRTQELLRSAAAMPKAASAKRSSMLIKLCILAFLVGASYTVTVWALIQPVIDLLVSIVAFSLAVICSVILGRILSQK